MVAARQVAGARAGSPQVVRRKLSQFRLRASFGEGCGLLRHLNEVRAAHVCDVLSRDSDTGASGPDSRMSAVSSGALVMPHGWSYKQIYAYNDVVRRKPGALVPLEGAILATLARLQRRDVPECHGYQIAKHLADALDHTRLTAYGTLYRALGRLEEMGLVQSRWEDPRIAADEARPSRRLYRLTDSGLAAVPIRSDRAAAASRAVTGRRRVARA
jgi:PadR family transcriptional regulator PadR